MHLYGMHTVNNARGWVTACLVKRVVVPQAYHPSSLELDAVGKSWKNVVKGK